MVRAAVRLAFLMILMDEEPTFLPKILLSCAGGKVCLPDLPLIDRGDGGHLVIDPPRDVWDRTELTREELSFWERLIAATAKAMLTQLPQLKDGCLNYWDAGNWALNEAAPPSGHKTGKGARHLHLHLFGRNPHAKHKDWKWGESPFFPAYKDRLAWAAEFQPLTAVESAAVVASAVRNLKTIYGVPAAQIAVSQPCATCGYPFPGKGPCPSCAK